MISRTSTPKLKTSDFIENNPSIAYSEPCSHCMIKINITLLSLSKKNIQQGIECFKTTSEENYCSNKCFGRSRAY